MVVHFGKLRIWFFLKKKFKENVEISMWHSESGKFSLYAVSVSNLLPFVFFTLESSAWPARDNKAALD